MKTKIITLLSIFVLSIMPAVAQQKYACVNTDYVLRCIPDYANAQKRIDKYVADWQKELTDKQSEIEELRAEYEQEKLSLAGQPEEAPSGGNQVEGAGVEVFATTALRCRRRPGQEAR